MSAQVALFGALGLVLFARGLYALVTHRSLLRRMLSVNVMATGIFLVLGALARRGEGPPDPVPHALVLTGIVVSVAVTGFGLTLVRRLMAAHPLPPEDTR